MRSQKNTEYKLASGSLGEDVATEIESKKSIQNKSKNKIEGKNFIRKKSVKRLFKIFSAFFIPFLLFYIDLAKICGYAYGLWHFYRLRTK